MLTYADACRACQGGLFTSLLDKNPMSTNFKVSPGLTEVEIIDFDVDRFVNIGAVLFFHFSCA